MDDYQRLLVTEFFEPLPSLSQESCHQFALHHIAPILLPDAVGKIDVKPRPFQGSMSYTTVLHTYEPRFAIQFRSDKQDLYGVSEASRIHGPIVPVVTYQGMYEGLFVYTSPFAEGTSYISVLTVSDTAISELASTLHEICQKVDNYKFRNTALKKQHFDLH